MSEPARTIRRDGSESLSHGPARGATRHVPGVCQCPRCKGFVEENLHARTNGASAVVSLRQRVAEIAEEIVASQPLLASADMQGVKNLALVTAQLEHATAALEQAYDLAKHPISVYTSVAGEKLQSLLDRIDRLVARSAQLEDRLARSPKSRGSLGLDLARTKAVVERSSSPDAVNFDELPIQTRVRVLDAIDAVLDEEDAA